MLQTDGSLGSINNNLDVNNAQNVSGLYFLGYVPNDGIIKSLCGFGKVDTSTYNGSSTDIEVVGIINFYVVRDGKPLERRFLRQNNNSLMRNCRANNVNICVRHSDSILVYIPSACRAGDGRIDCPLQVNFQSKGNYTGYYEGSDVIDMVSPKLNQIQDVLELDTQQPVPVNTTLNVQVTFEGIAT